MSDPAALSLVATSQTTPESLILTGGRVVDVADGAARLDVASSPGTDASIAST